MRSRPSAAMAEIITRVNRLTRWDWPASAAATGRAAKAASKTSGTRSGWLRHLAAKSARREVLGISPSFRRKQSGRTDIEDERHQQVDQHRGDGRPDRARRRRRHDEPQDVDG